MKSYHILFIFKNLRGPRKYYASGPKILVAPLEPTHRINRSIVDHQLLLYWSLTTIVVHIGRNPRPICVPIFPPAWTRSRVCLKFSNVYFVGRNVHLCLSMEAQTEKKPVFAVDFNCVRMGTLGVALLKPEDGGGLEPPAPQDPAEGTTAAAAVAAVNPTTSSTVVKKNKPKPHTWWVWWLVKTWFGKSYTIIINR